MVIEDPNLVSSYRHDVPVVILVIPTRRISAGGVGNSTLAIETGIQLKAAKRTRGRRICLVDLDFQNSHVCDYLRNDSFIP